MPFKSERQRRFMFSQHPDIAKRWAREGQGNVSRSRSSSSSRSTRRSARRGSR